METTEIKTVKKTTENKGRFKPKTLEEFIQEAQEIHQDINGEPKYLYDKTVYVSNLQKIIITCKIHGDFELSPKTHKEGRGCKICTKTALRDKFKSNKDEFVNKAKKIHKDEDNEPLYIYDEVVYVDSSTPVIIKCQQGHRFEQTPLNHLKGGCKECGGNMKMNNDVFIKKATAVHSDSDGEALYDYSLVDYINIRTKVIIVCKNGHTFEQRPDHHLSGHGCFECNTRKTKK